MRAALLLAPSLLLLVPAALAGTSGPPGPFTHLAWIDGERLATQRGLEPGVFHFGNGTFSAVNETTAYDLRLAASPDGRWLVHAYGAPWMPSPTTNGWVVPGATTLHDLQGGGARALLPSGSAALASGPRHLYLAHWSEGLLRTPWDELGQPEVITVIEEAQEVGLRLALDAEERRLAMLLRAGDASRLLLLDLQGAPQQRWVPGEVGAVVALAPAGDRVAIPTGGGLAPGTSTHLRIVDAHALETLAERELDGTVTDLAWGRAGLAVATFVYHDTEPVTSNTTLLLLDDRLGTLAQADPGRRVERLAWSGSGDRLAAGTGLTLRLYDTALRPVGVWTMPEWPPPACCLGEPPPAETEASSDGEPTDPETREARDGTSGTTKPAGQSEEGTDAGEPLREPRPAPAVGVASALGVAALAAALRRRSE